MSCSDIFLGFIAILFPPVAVWIKSGVCSLDSLINILLCTLGYIPGLLHAWYIIAKNPEYDYEPIDEEGQQRVTYYYVSHENAPRDPRRQYGTVGSRTAPPTLPANKPQPQYQQRPNGAWSNETGAGGSSSGGTVARPQPPAGPSEGAGSNEAGAPPSYADAVKGDHKIQTQD